MATIHKNAHPPLSVLLGLYIPKDTVLFGLPVCPLRSGLKAKRALSWLHSFRVWTSHCVYLGLYLDHADLYLGLYLRGTVRCSLAYCLVNPKNWSLWWKLGGTAVKKPQVWSPWSFHLWPFDPVGPPLAGARARAGLSTFESSAIHQGTKYAHQKKRTVLEFAARYKIAH